MKKFKIKLHRKLRPKYSRGERVFSSITHVIGGLFGIVALVLGLLVAYKHSDKYGIISMIIYGVSMLFIFTVGALWRFCSKDKDSWTYNMLDHRRIFMLIVATFTPFCLITIREVFDLGWLLFFISWFFAIIGIIFDLYRPGRPFTQLLNLACYICICACGGMIFISSIGHLHLDGYFWIVVGIVCYMIGNVFHYFSFRKTNWYFIWYLFLIGGTVSFFVSILNYVLV